MKFGAIDIGSNAVRLLLARVIEGEATIFKKETLVRMPLRLGEDSFRLGKIGDDKVEQLIDTMNGFRSLLRAYPAKDFLACATSAMREAENGEVVARRILDETGIELNIITGRREAEVIYANHIEERLDKRTDYIYIDVGGGSTEVSVISQGQIVTSESFQIGTVRSLHGMVDKKTWRSFREWLEATAANHKRLVGIGTGGNINKLFKLSRIKDGQPMPFKRLVEMHKYLRNHSVEERIEKLGMRPDRADVIVPAAKIYISAMKWSGAKKVHVPQIGLSDGIIHVLYERHRNGSSA